MAIKDIVVHIDTTKACEHRISVALRLAKKHGAHVTALFARSNSILVPFGGIVAERDDGGVAAAEAKVAFDVIFADSGIETVWITADCAGALERVIDTTLFYARHADLTIVGQYDATQDDTGVPSDFAERLVLESGRPVLVVPYAGRSEHLGKRVLVAWNGSREAIRAVNDAMSILKKAKEVTVLSLNPRNDKQPHGDMPSADITRHLEHHGVKARAQYLNVADIDAGDMLLSYLADEGSDLLVMGGYGQSRFRELILGGATRQILQQMTVPVFMSH